MDPAYLKAPLFFWQTVAMRTWWCSVRLFGFLFGVWRVFVTRFVCLPSGKGCGMEV